MKNIIQSILHSHLIPSCPHADLCGASGRAWLFHQVLPEDERLAVERHLREFDRLGDDLKVIERVLARSALGDEGVKRLMTIPWVVMVVAFAIVAAIGVVGRFEQSQKLVSYLGPSTRVCANRVPGASRITAGSPSRAVGMRAACLSRRGLGGSASAGSVARVLLASPRLPCGQHVAAVATARKLAVLIWHLLSKGESYVWASASVAREESCAASGAERGIASRPCAWPKRRGPRVQYQEPSRSGAPMGRASRDGLRALRLRLEPAWSQAGAHGRRNRGATMKAARQGLRLAPCSSPRGHPCARGK